MSSHTLMLCLVHLRTKWSSIRRAYVCRTVDGMTPCLLMISCETGGSVLRKVHDMTTWQILVNGELSRDGHIECILTRRTADGSPSSVNGAGLMVNKPLRLPYTTSVRYRSPSMTRAACYSLLVGCRQQQAPEMLFKVNSIPSRLLGDMPDNTNAQSLFH